MVAAIYAVGPKNEFGSNGSMPWNCPKDLQRFAAVTRMYDNIIVGRTTYKTLPPLNGRNLIVVCRNPETYQNKERRLNVRWMTLEQALQLPNAIVIGGNAILHAAWPAIHLVMKSTIHQMDLLAITDRYFDRSMDSFSCIYTENHSDHLFQLFLRTGKC